MKITILWIILGAHAQDPSHQQTCGGTVYAASTHVSASSCPENDPSCWQELCQARTGQWHLWSPWSDCRCDGLKTRCRKHECATYNGIQDAVELQTCVQSCDTEKLMSETNILVISSKSYSDLEPYITNGDGSETSAVQIGNCQRIGRSAIVKGKLHLFGGYTGKMEKYGKIIARLDDCTLVELPYKLNFSGRYGHAALSISDNSEALICFDETNWKSCDVFTGSSVESRYSTSYSHNNGQLGFYNGQPITVGSLNSDGNRKVETLTSTGWTSLADSPMNYFGHQLIGLKNDLLMIGGKDMDDGDAFTSHIWRLSDNSWSQEADLKQKVAFGSAILTGNSIFIIGGYDGTYSYSQRIDIEENDEIAGVEQIVGRGGTNPSPALFVTSPDYCISRNPPSILLVIPTTYQLSYKFVIDWQTNIASKTDVAIKRGSNKSKYNLFARSALIRNKVHLFGGYEDKRRIFRLDSCSIIELLHTLYFDAFMTHAALTIENGSKALICFDSNVGKFCNTFDGQAVSQDKQTSFSHSTGGLAYYNGRPTTVGSYLQDGTSKVETRDQDGTWLKLEQDHPENIFGHTLIGLQNKDLLMIGGMKRAVDSFETLSSIWRLNKNGWNQESSFLKKAGSSISSIILGQSIYVFFAAENAVTPGHINRIDLDETEDIIKVSVIDTYDDIFAPILTTSDECRFENNFNLTQVDDIEFKRISDDYVDFESAIQLCESSGGRLSYIDNEDEFIKFGRDILDRKIASEWLGLSNPENFDVSTEEVEAVFGIRYNWNDTNFYDIIYKFYPNIMNEENDDENADAVRKKVLSCHKKYDQKYYRAFFSHATEYNYLQSQQPSDCSNRNKFSCRYDKCFEKKTCYDESVFCDKSWCLSEERKYACAKTCYLCGYPEYKKNLTIIDRGETCTRKEIRSLNCEHFCEKKSQQIAQCSCFSGFVLKTGGNRCEEIDQCTANTCANSTPFNACKNLLGPETVCILPNNMTESTQEKSIIDENKYPWLLHILTTRWVKEEAFGKVHICGGVFITTEFVVTAAHCVHDIERFGYEEWTNITLVAGVSKIINIDSNYYNFVGFDENMQPQKFKVRDIIIHDEFDFMKGHNDLAIIKTTKMKTNINSFEPQIISLNPSHKMIENVLYRCRVAGFGRYDSETDYANLLFDAQTPIVSDHHCSNDESFFEKKEICAGWNDGRYGSCEINIGAPLMCPNENDKNKWLLTGILQGRQNSNKSSFGLYTDIGAYYDWIIKKTSPCRINYGTSTCSLLKYGNSLFEKDAKFAGIIEHDFNIDLMFKSVDGPERSLFTYKSRKKRPSADISAIVQKYLDSNADWLVGYETSMECPLDEVTFIDNGRSSKHAGAKHLECTTKAEVEKQKINELECKKKKEVWKILEFMNIKNLYKQFSKILQDLNQNEEGIKSKIGPNKNPDNSFSCTMKDENKVTENDYPWMVYISLRKNDHDNLCGGVLISKNLVLTAAHCLDEFRNKSAWKDITVVAGVLRKTDKNEYKSSNDTEPQKYRVVQIQIHQNYTKSTENDDLAIMKIEKKDTSRNAFEAKPIRRHLVTEIKHKKCCIAAGFGAGGSGGGANNVINHAPIPIRPYSYCDGMKNFSKDLEICGGFENGNHDTCEGDSGGPLMCPSKSKENNEVEWLLTGIVKGGDECGSGFGIYTDIRKYDRWIKDTSEKMNCSVNYGKIDCKAIKFKKTLYVKDALFTKKDYYRDRTGTQYLSVNGKEQSLFMMKRQSSSTVWVFIQDGVEQSANGYDNTNITVLFKASDSCPFDVNRSYDHQNKEVHSQKQMLECANKDEIKKFLYPRKTEIELLRKQNKRRLRTIYEFQQEWRKKKKLSAAPKKN